MVLLFGIDKKQDKIYDNIDPCPQKFHHCSSHDNSSEHTFPLENLEKPRNVHSTFINHLKILQPTFALFLKE